jgi:hypothetical protein
MATSLAVLVMPHKRIARYFASRFQSMATVDNLCDLVTEFCDQHIFADPLCEFERDDILLRVFPELGTAPDHDGVRAFLLRLFQDAGSCIALLSVLRTCVKAIKFPDSGDHGSSEHKEAWLAQQSLSIGVVLSAFDRGVLYLAANRALEAGAWSALQQYGSVPLMQALSRMGMSSATSGAAVGVFSAAQAVAVASSLPAVVFAEAQSQTIYKNRANDSVAEQSEKSAGRMGTRIGASTGLFAVASSVATGGAALTGSAVAMTVAAPVVMAGVGGVAGYRGFKAVRKRYVRQEIPIGPHGPPPPSGLRVVNRSGRRAFFTLATRSSKNPLPSKEVQVEDGAAWDVSGLPEGTTSIVIFDRNDSRCFPTCGIVLVYTAGLNPIPKWTVDGLNGEVALRKIAADGCLPAGHPLSNADLSVVSLCVFNVGGDVKLSEFTHGYSTGTSFFRSCYKTVQLQDGEVWFAYSAPLAKGPAGAIDLWDLCLRTGKYASAQNTFHCGDVVLYKGQPEPASGGEPPEAVLGPEAGSGSGPGAAPADGSHESGVEKTPPVPSVWQLLQGDPEKGVWAV